AGAGNFFTDRMVEGINERGRPTQFALGLAAKDAGLLLDVARDTAVPTPLATAVAEALSAAVGAGLGERDFTDLVELIERQAGVTRARPTAPAAPDRRRAPPTAARPPPGRGPAGRSLCSCLPPSDLARRGVPSARAGANSLGGGARIRLRR